MAGVIPFGRLEALLVECLTWEDLSTANGQITTKAIVKAAPLCGQLLSSAPLSLPMAARSFQPKLRVIISM